MDRMGRRARASPPYLNDWGLIGSDHSPEPSLLRPTRHARIILADKRNGSKNASLCRQKTTKSYRDFKLAVLVLWRTLPTSSSVKVALSRCPCSSSFPFVQRTTRWWLNLRLFFFRRAKNIAASQHCSLCGKHQFVALPPVLQATPAATYRLGRVFKRYARVVRRQIREPDLIFNSRRWRFTMR
jgi:hypothetical protein